MNLCIILESMFSQPECNLCKSRADNDLHLLTQLKIFVRTKIHSSIHPNGSNDKSPFQLRIKSSVIVAPVV